MSLLDTASLIVTPNGYKEGKLYSVIPSDGSGDMSVTRATTATRVNSAGLVELVPYNLFQYSEQIDNGYWSKYQSTITANNTTAPNGTLTADRLTQNGASAGTFYVFPSAFSGGLVSLSCFYKKGIGNIGWLEINRGAESCYIQFNLDTQVISASGNYLSTNIENVGNGWYRCSVVSNQSAGTANYVGFGNIGNNGDTIFVWGAQLNEGTIKPYQKTETRLNIPRLDYSNGTCPSLLVEPQRTNLLTYSSSFDNAAWVKNNATITANNTTAPDGTMTADKVVVSANTDNVIQTGLPFVGVGNSNTISLYIKGSGSNIGKEVGLYIDREGGGTYEASTVVGVLTAEWQRIEVTHTWANSQSSVRYKISQAIVTTPASEFFIWGAQLEAGTYPTSYIPTTSASVTRNADVISKTGISSLIGQTEGVVFWDINVDILSASGHEDIFNIDNGAFGNTIYLIKNANATFAAEVYNASSVQCSFINIPISAVGRYKLALAYKTNDFAFYVNGVLVGSDTSGSVGAMSRIQLGQTVFGPSTGYTNASALWKTRLTNTQLAALTTI